MRKDFKFIPSEISPLNWLLSVSLLLLWKIVFLRFWQSWAVRSLRQIICLCSLQWWGGNKRNWLTYYLWILIWVHFFFHFSFFNPFIFFSRIFFLPMASEVRTVSFVWEYVSWNLRCVCFHVCVFKSNECYICTCLNKNVWAYFKFYPYCVGS